MAILADSRLGRFIGALGYRPVPSSPVGTHRIQADSALGRYIGALAEPGSGRAARVRMTSANRVLDQAGHQPRRDEHADDTNQGMAHAPFLAEDWASAASRVISDAIEETELLAETSRQAIEAASSQLKDTQDKAQTFIEQFSSKILQTNQQVLQALVQQQIDPLLGQMQNLLDQFRAQQDAHITAVTDLTQGVRTTRDAAADLAGSAQALTGSAQSIAQRLTSVSSSQERLASQADLYARLQEMTSSITSASESLQSAQASLAATAGALSMSAADLREATTSMVTAIRDAGSIARPRRRWWWIFRR